MADDWTLPALKEHFEKLREADHRAIEIAMERSKEILALHNDLIRKSERAAATYVTRGQVYSALATALVIIGLVIAYYANFGGAA